MHHQVQQFGDLGLERLGFGGRSVVVIGYRLAGETKVAGKP